MPWIEKDIQSFHGWATNSDPELVKRCTPITAIFPQTQISSFKPFDILLQAATICQSTKLPRVKPIYNTNYSVHRLADPRQDSGLLRTTQSLASGLVLVGGSIAVIKTTTKCKLGEERVYFILFFYITVYHQRKQGRLLCLIVHVR